MVRLLVIIFLLTLVLTGCIRRYALSRKLLDMPNHRSSHSVPTPRGGGLAIVLSLLVILPFIYHCGMVTPTEIIALGFSGGVVAVIGWLDDHYSIAALYRFIGYFFASIWALYWFGGMPAIVLFGYVLPMGLLANALAILYLSWLINLYNFMDGIDGLAAVEAICVCVGAALVYWLSGVYSLMGVPLLLAASVGGFLYWNAPPARIFMGDVGSCFLGFMLGGFSIHAAMFKPEFFWSWLILLGVFIVDATFTLMRRMLAGEKIYEAHCTHAYQHAAASFKHRPVTLAVFIINVFWLYPLAIGVGTGSLNPFLGIILAYVPLLVLAIQFNAGKVYATIN